MTTTSPLTAPRQNSQPTPPAPAAGATGHRLRVATYNIHSCVGLDRRCDPARVTDTLLEIDADIIALQEVGWHHRGQPNLDQFAYLAEATGYHVTVGLTKHHTRAHYGNALLTRQPPASYRRVWLSRPLHIPRAAIDARMTVADTPLRVINVHLALSPWERRRQALHLLAMIEHEPDTSVLLLGDFNNWRPQVPAFQALSARLPRHVALPTYHARMPRARLDRIYATADWHIDDCQVWRTQASAKASDHLPLVADVTLNGAG